MWQYQVPLVLTVTVYVVPGLPPVILSWGMPQLPSTLFDGDELLLQAHRRHRAGERVLDSDAGAGTLGLRDLVRRTPARDDPIRDPILSSLAGDTTFVAAQDDATFRALDRKLGPEIINHDASGAKTDEPFDDGSRSCPPRSCRRSRRRSSRSRATWRGRPLASWSARGSSTSLDTLQRRIVRAVTGAIVVNAGVVKRLAAA